MDTVDTNRDTKPKSWHGDVSTLTSPQFTGQSPLAELSLQADQSAAVALLEDIFSGIDYGIALMDEDLNFVLFNEKYAELAFGDGVVPKIGDNAVALSVKQLDTGLFLLPDGLDPAVMSEAMVSAITSCQSAFPLERRDGRHLMASAKRTALGGYLVSVSDVTDRKRAEASEAERQKALASMVDALEEGLSLWDADFRFVMCNDKYMEIVAPWADAPFEPGMRGEELLARAYASGIQELPEEMTEAAYVQGYMDWVRAHGGPIEVTYTNGRTFVATAKQTDLGGVLITAVDVTEERNSEAKALAMLGDAMEALEEGFGLWDSNLGFVMCNQKYMDYVLPFRSEPFPVGMSAGDGAREIFRAGLVDFPDGVTEDDIVADIENWVQTFGAPREFQFKDGRVVLITAKPTDLGGFLVTAVDVTEERNSEARARDMLLDAFQAFDEGLVLCDENMNLVYGNDAWKRMNYEGRDHLVPEPGTSAIDSVIALVKDGFYAIPEGMTEDDYIAWIMDEMSQHGKQVHVSLADGRHHIGSSHLTAFGGSLMVVRDVTEQRAMAAELEQQRETAHQNEKLSALGELLAGVAHELNNPLSVVFGYSQMLQGKIDDPVLSERIDLICQSSERAAKIVRTFLAMARQRPTKMEPCRVNDIVDTALEVSGYSLKSNGTQVEVAFDDSDPVVTGDFDQLAQVFSNLIVNAGHAVGDKRASGKISIRTDVSNGAVRVEITDNGHGIPDDIQSRIFEPFFTTKDVGEGTGIGLAFSHRIVESHDGALSVTSKLGQGTSFFVTLRATDPVETTPDHPAQPAKTTHSVLVVDDEEGVAQLIADMLSDEGFAVSKSTDPRAALRLAEREQFDTILSDFKMPQMNGETFYSALEVIAPGNANRTGFITGDAMSAQVVRFFGASKRPHIEKPIMKNELLDLVWRASGKAS